MGIQKGKLIILSAPSGAGKTTLCQRLLQMFPEKIELSISVTTRAPRDGEENGREYHFVSKETFEDLISKKEFAEYAQVHGNYYGTSQKIVSETLEAGRSVLLDIDVQGADSLRKSFPGQCVSIFIAPPNINELKRRLRGRGTESEDAIGKRLQHAISEMEHIDDYDHTILNDDLDRAFDQLQSIFKKDVLGEG